MLSCDNALYNDSTIYEHVWTLALCLIWKDILFDHKNCAWIMDELCMYEEM